MTRGVVVAVLLGGLAGSVQAREVTGARSPGARITEARTADALQDFRIRGPLTFDLAVRSRDGRTAIYRYDRARRTAALVDHLEDADVPRRTQGFQLLTEEKIVLPPEGSPWSPLPGGGPRGWSLPDADREAALEAVKGLAPEGQVMSIGQIQAAMP